MTEKQIRIFCCAEPDILAVNKYLSEAEGLAELAAVLPMAFPMALPAGGIAAETPNAVCIDESGVCIKPDWIEQRPAFVFPKRIPFTKNNFLGILFGLLGYEEKYSELLKDFPDWLLLFDAAQKIISGEEADVMLASLLKKDALSSPFENYAFNHNAAVALNYCRYENAVGQEVIEAYYNAALELALEPEYKAYTLKYYIAFLMDNNLASQAREKLDLHAPESLAAYPKFSLERIRQQAVLRTTSFPVDASLLTEAKERLRETLHFFESRGHKIMAGLLCADVAAAANICHNHAEALEYISKAISYFKNEGQEEMAAQAQLASGRLWHERAQNGHPQCRRNALESYQEALKVFTRNEAPQVFADIHHQLGIIYAELPDDPKKQRLWATAAASSFTEALNYYNKEERPYGYGMVCCSFANACSKFPEGVESEALEKALWLYNEALTVRPASSFPVERAVTLLNYLEISWKAGNPEKGFNMERYNDMLQKANEIKTLTKDEPLLREAGKHLELLEELGNKSGQRAVAEFRGGQTQSSG